MPYITEAQRDTIDPALDGLIDELSEDDGQIDGQINYVITRLLLYMINMKRPNYERYEKAIGLLECAKLELYRRLVSRYEDKKVAENGDVYN